LELVPLGNVDNVVKLAGILGCGIVSLPLKYHGTKIMSFARAAHDWEVNVFTGVVFSEGERRK
jgi:hypothetical protein